MNPWLNHNTEFFRLNPPDSVNVNVYNYGRDIYGNPTAEFSLAWSDGAPGPERRSGWYSSPRREQVGYGDKVSAAAMAKLPELFPRTRWAISPDGIQGSRSESSASFTAVRDYDAEPVPVIFRMMPGKQYESDGPTACFPTLPGTYDDSTFQIYVHIGQHGSASRSWYQRTRAAKPEEYADLRRELESAPFNYRLELRNRWSADFDTLRQAALARMNGGN